MLYTMTKPCPECPFRRDGTGGTPVRLRSDRIEEIAGLMLGGRGDFPCHKTTVPDDAEECGLRATEDSLHCAGALIFAEKNETSTQMMRVVERLGLYDPSALDKDSFDEVFDDIDEMRATAIQRPPPAHQNQENPDPMSTEQEAAELNKLREVLEERGILGVLAFCAENAADTLGVANTALTRGGLVVARRLIDYHGRPATQLHALLGALADGATFARVACTSEGCPLDPAERLSIMKLLDEVGWRFQSAADRAAKAARRE